MESGKKLLLATACAAFTMAGLQTANATAVTYNPGLGTLPDAQGFTSVGIASPVPIVSSGVLHQFPVLVDDSQNWYSKAIPTNFTTGAYELTASLRVISSNYIPNIGTGPRFGYYLWALDDNFHGFIVGITDSGVAFDTSIFFGTGNDFAVTPFNTTGGFHDYRVSIVGGKGSLFIDGNLIDTLSLGPAIFGSQNGVAFGDVSGRGISETELAGFRFGTPAAVPEPGTLALLLAAGLGGARALLRRRETRRALLG